jgi:hypothetical protein
MNPLPPAAPGTELRILATTDLGARTVPMRESWGASGTCAGVVRLLEDERERQPAGLLDRNLEAEPSGVTAGEALAGALR